MIPPRPSAGEREEARHRRRWRARRALVVDMLKSYAAPLVLAAFITPLLNPSPDGGLHLRAFNYGCLLAGLVMMGLALILVRERD